MSKLPKKSIAKKTLIASVVFMVISCALVAGIAFAWFSVTDKPEMSGSLVQIAKNEHNGYQFVSMNDGHVPPDGFIIHPGDSFSFKVQALQDNFLFGLRVDSRRYSNEQFATRFSDREDLISGIYQKQEVLQGIGQDDSEVTYHEFDIDLYLSGKGLSDLQKNQHKTNFLKAFTDNNSIFPTLTLKVVKVGSVACNVTLDTTDTGSTARAYYLEGFNNIAKNTILEVEVYFGYTDFLPTATYDFGFGDNAATYRLLNYNCFIGQGVNLSFLNS